MVRKIVGGGVLMMVFTKIFWVAPIQTLTWIWLALNSKNMSLMNEKLKLKVFSNRNRCLKDKQRFLIIR